MTNELTIDTTARSVEVLTPHEQRNKARNLAIIRAGKKHFMRTGRALYRMHRDKLWRDDYPSFTAFVVAELGWTYKRAMQIVAAISISTVVDIPIPNERVGREVLKLPEENRAKVLILAHKASGGRLDTGWIKDAAEIHDEMQATGGFVDDGDGGMTEAHRAVVDHRLERLSRQRQHIKDSEDGKRKAVRLLDYTPFRVVDVDVLFKTAKIVFEDEAAARAFVHYWRDHEAGLHMTVHQREPDPFDAPLSIVGMAAQRI